MTLPFVLGGCGSRVVVVVLNEALGTGGCRVA